MTKPKYGPYEFMIRYDQTERKLIFVVNGEKNVWDIAELDNPREQPVARSAKKSAVAERTLAERKFCEIDQFYYSEIITCPICYGADRERERIIKLLEEQIVKNVVYQHTQRMWNGGYASGQNEWNGGQDGDQAYIQSMAGYLIALIKGEKK